MLAAYPELNKRKGCVFVAEPLDLNRYVKLTAKRALSADNAKAWYQCVKEHGPSGVATSVATLDDDHNQRNVRMVHRDTDAGHEYIVPLSRDLGGDEVDNIVEAFASLRPKLDFDVETNETKLLAKDQSEIPLDAAKHMALCAALSKHSHEDWVRERCGAGWRYGIRFDSKEKTHPLLRSWDQLPDRFRTPDMDWPQKLVSLLNDYGYAIIHKEELDHLLELLAAAT